MKIYMNMKTLLAVVLTVTISCISAVKDGEKDLTVSAIVSSYIFYDLLWSSDFFDHISKLFSKTIILKLINKLTSEKLN